MSENKFSDQFIETVRNRSDLIAVVSEYLSLKKSGQNFVGLCPFHIEKSGSFSVNPSKQFFHCFGCAVGGDVFSFVSKIEQISFPEAVRRLAEKTGVPIPSDPENRSEATPAEKEAEILYRINEEAALLFHHNLIEQPAAQSARDYLKARGITTETMKKFLIGFAMPRRDDLMKRLKYPPALLEKAGLLRKGDTGLYDYFRNRIVIPIQTLQEKTIGFGARAMDDAQPKYLNTSETPLFTKGKNLFGLNWARGKKTLIVVEGYFDVISLHQAGVSNAVATLGTAMTEDHLRLIRRFVEKVTLLFDPDPAGVAAAARVAPLFVAHKMDAEVVTLPPGLDPDLFIRKEGQDAFLSKIKQGEPLVAFTIRQTARTASASITDKAKTIQTLFPLLHKMTNHVEQGYYLQLIAEVFGMEEQDVRLDFDKPSVEGNRRSVSEKVAIVPVLKSRLPKNEETLLALLVQDQLEYDLLAPISPNDFTTQQTQTIARFFWDEERNAWTHPNVATLKEAAQHSLFSELAVLEILNENRSRLTKDNVASVQKKRIAQKTLQVQGELKSAVRIGDRQKAQALQQDFFRLKKELSQIGSLHLHE
ncbi:MAG: DNA primase [Nitrospirota bacterium]